MQKFDRAFEGAILWVTLTVLAATLLHSCASRADSLPPPPSSITMNIDDEVYECFETEEYRTVVLYVRVIAPDLHERLELTTKTLQYSRDENALLAQQVSLLEQKVDVTNLHLTATLAERDDLRLQAQRLKLSRDTKSLLHWLVHGISAAAVVGLTAAYLGEKND